MSELTRQQREKLEREDTIISKAEKLFCSKGFEKTSMDDIARESEYTKRTVYRYFTCKEDLFFAVALRGYSRLLDIIKEQSKTGCTGFEKVRLAYYAYYDFFCKYPKQLQLINMGGMVKSNLPDVDVPYRKKYMDFDNLLFKELIGMFHAGKSDSSIRPDLDISHLAFSSIFIAAGFFQMLSLSGITFTNHFGLNKDEFVRFTIEMMVDSLKRK